MVATPEIAADEQSVSAVVEVEMNRRRTEDVAGGHERRGDRVGDPERLRRRDAGESSGSAASASAVV